jgi:hypothetical protein
MWNFTVGQARYLLAFLLRGIKYRMKSEYTYHGDMRSIIGNLATAEGSTVGELGSRPEKADPLLLRPRSMNVSLCITHRENRLKNPFDERSRTGSRMA